MKQLKFKIAKILAILLMLFCLSSAKADVDFSFGLNFNFDQWYSDYYEPCSSVSVTALPIVWSPNIYYSWESYESDWLWVNFNFFKCPRVQYYCEPVYYSYYPYQTVYYDNYFNSCYYNNSGFRYGYYCPAIKIVNYNIYRNRNYCQPAYVLHHKHNKIRKERFRPANGRQKTEDGRRRTEDGRRIVSAKRPVVKERINPIKRSIVRERINPIKRPVIKERINPIKRPVVKERINPIKRPIVKKRTRPAQRPIVKKRTRPIRQIVHKKPRPKVVNKPQNIRFAPKAATTKRPQTRQSLSNRTKNRSINKLNNDPRIVNNQRRR